MQPNFLLLYPGVFVDHTSHSKYDHEKSNESIRRTPSRNAFRPPPRTCQVGESGSFVLVGPHADRKPSLKFMVFFFSGLPKTLFFSFFFFFF